MSTLTGEILSKIRMTEVCLHCKVSTVQRKIKDVFVCVECGTVQTEAKNEIN